MKCQEPFEGIWTSRNERLYNHWCIGEPQNQIQLAFRNHWLTFQEIMQDKKFNKGKRCLEVGCGRGSLSCYYSAADYDCTLVDISPSIIKVAQDIFQTHQLKAKFVVADANNLPFENGSFDIVFSIGLLEHFEDVRNIIREQVRVLSQGGIFIGYVVPENRNQVQKNYTWINKILEGYVGSNKSESTKESIYRSEYTSSYYTELMLELGLTDIRTRGVYPLPMISPSIEFPFTLMPPESELSLVSYLKDLLQKRQQETGENPWFCNESYGQAFLVWGFK